MNDDTGEIVVSHDFSRALSITQQSFFMSSNRTKRRQVVDSRGCAWKDCEQLSVLSIKTTNDLIILKYL